MQNAMIKIKERNILQENVKNGTNKKWEIVKETEAPRGLLSRSALHHPGVGRLSDDQVIRVKAEIIRLYHSTVVSLFRHHVQKPYVSDSLVRKPLKG